MTPGNNMTDFLITADKILFYNPNTKKKKQMLKKVANLRTSNTQNLDQWVRYVITCGH